MDPEPTTGDSGAGGSNSSEHMTHALSGFIAARVELASIEAKEAASLADQWLHGKADWLPGWAAVVLALAIIHAVIALICYLKLKQQPATPLFELSRKEIENDKLWLTKNK